MQHARKCGGAERAQEGDTDDCDLHADPGLGYIGEVNERQPSGIKHHNVTGEEVRGLEQSAKEGT